MKKYIILSLIAVLSVRGAWAFSGAAPGTPPNIPSQLPVPVNQGGTQCGAPSTVANLPISPTAGMRCTVTDAWPTAPGAKVVSSGTGPDISVFYDGSNWRGGEASSGGGLNNTLVTGTGGTIVNPTCKNTTTNTTDTTPSIDFVRYALTGAGTLTINLPTSGCLDGDWIDPYTVQGANNTGVAFSTSASGGINGYTCWTIGSSSGNTEEWGFKWDASTSTWNGHCGGTNPQSAYTVAMGGTALATLTAHAVQVGAGTSAPAQVGPSSSTGAPLLSAGSSANPAFAGFTLSTPNPALSNSQYLTSGTTYTTPTGCLDLKMIMCSGGGGGGGAQTTSETSNCAGAGGGSAACATVDIPSPTTSYTYAIGAAGTAGSNAGTPVAGGNGGNTTLTVGSTTLSLNPGNGGGASSGNTCGTLGNGGTQGSAPSGNVAWGSAASIFPSSAGVVGQAGTATSTVSHGGTTGNAGGNGGTVNSSGSSVVTPQAGAAGYIVAICTGGTAY